MSPALVRPVSKRTSYCHPACTSSDDSANPPRRITTASLATAELGKVAIEPDAERRNSDEGVIEHRLWMSTGGDGHTVPAATQRGDPFEEASMQHIGALTPDQVPDLHLAEHRLVEADPRHSTTHANLSNNARLAGAGRAVDDHRSTTGHTLEQRWSLVGVQPIDALAVRRREHHPPLASVGTGDDVDPFVVDRERVDLDVGGAERNELVGDSRGVMRVTNQLAERFGRRQLTEQRAQIVPFTHITDRRWRQTVGVR